MNFDNFKKYTQSELFRVFMLAQKKEHLIAVLPNDMFWLIFMQFK